MRIKYSLWIGDARWTPKKSKKSQWLGPQCLFKKQTFLSTIDWRRDHTIRSFRLSRRPGFPVIPAFRSFQLSGHSGYLVVPAARSFLAILRSFYRPCKQKKLQQEAHRTSYGLLSKKSPINFVGLCANWNTRCKENNKFKMKLPRSQTNTQPLSSSLPTLFFCAEGCLNDTDNTVSPDIQWSPESLTPVIIIQLRISARIFVSVKVALKVHKHEIILNFFLT